MTPAQNLAVQKLIAGKSIAWHGLCGPTAFAWIWLAAICCGWGLVLLVHIFPSLETKWPNRGSFGFWFGWFMMYYSL